MRLGMRSGVRPYRRRWRRSGTARLVRRTKSVAAANDMNEADRRNDSQDGRPACARLKQDSNDVEGWLRLARAYMVLNEPEKVARRA